MHPAAEILALLANATNRALICELEAGPSYPRALARRLGVTEGQAQKHLRQLARAGLLQGAWHHDGKTVKRYTLRVDAVRLEFAGGSIQPVLVDAVGSPPDRPRN